MSAAPGAAVPSEASIRIWCSASRDALPVVDDETFEALVDALGEPDAVASVLRMYLADLPGFVGTIRSVAPDVHEEARAAAHRLKGNAGMLGALALSDACRRFETAIRDREFESLPALSAEVLEASEAVAEWVRQRLGQGRAR